MPVTEPHVSQPLTLLCLASFDKGHAFLKEAKRLGCRVFLLTSASIKDTASFPRESLDDIFYMPDVEQVWNTQETLLAVAHLYRTTRFDRIVALDDFDLEKAAVLREHFRLPGLGDSATRFFRDKLAMRVRAGESGIEVPPFTGVANYEEITRFVDSVPAPWVLKPRLMAGSIGIKKYEHRQEVWDRIHSLGDRQSLHLLERFVPGDIFHVDSIWFRGQMAYAIASAYGKPPLEVSHGGGIFTTRLMERGSEAARDLMRMNEQVLKAFGLSNGISHTEFIRAHEDGKLYFLETSARVAGAHIAELIEAGTNINLWAEWARLEVAAATGSEYAPPQPANEYGGLLVSLARSEWPDTSVFADPEVVWRLKKKQHIGLIVKSPDYKRISDLLQQYTERIQQDFHASAPPREVVRE